MLYANYYTHASEGTGRRSTWSRFRAWLPWHASDARGEVAYLDGLQPGRVLDLGCGDGARLARLSSKGWSVVGYDADRNAVDAARMLFGGDVRVGTVDDVEARDGFDAIVMFHVLEHVEDPLATLIKARELLRPGGVLSVVTPNAASWLHAIYRGRWRGLEPPRHFQIFSPSGLRRLLGNAGFDQTETFTTARNASGMAFASEKSYGSPTPTFLRLSLAAKSELLQALEWLRIRWSSDCGEELVAHAVVCPRL